MTTLVLPIILICVVLLLAGRGSGHTRLTGEPDVRLPDECE